VVEKEGDVLLLAHLVDDDEVSAVAVAAMHGYGLWPMHVQQDDLAAYANRRRCRKLREVGEQAVVVDTVDRIHLRKLLRRVGRVGQLLQRLRAEPGAHAPELCRVADGELGLPPAGSGAAGQEGGGESVRVEGGDAEALGGARPQDVGDVHREVSTRAAKVELVARRPDERAGVLAHAKLERDALLHELGEGDEVLA
jgi:hypothetical protein